jgi:hypothetical protein
MENDRAGEFFSAMNKEADKIRNSFAKIIKNEEPIPEFKGNTDLVSNFDSSRYEYIQTFSPPFNNTIKITGNVEKTDFTMGNKYSENPDGHGPANEIDLTTGRFKSFLWICHATGKATIHCGILFSVPDGVINMANNKPYRRIGVNVKIQRYSESWAWYNARNDLAYVPFVKGYSKILTNLRGINNPSLTINQAKEHHDICQASANNDGSQNDQIKQTDIDDWNSFGLTDASAASVAFPHGISIAVLAESNFIAQYDGDDHPHGYYLRDHDGACGWCEGTIKEVSFGIC